MNAPDFNHAAATGFLKQEIDAVDAFIATLGDADAQFCSRLQAGNITLARPEAEVSHFAYYKCSTNTFHYRAGLSLPLLFNLRVHEGAHALQAYAVPHITVALNNMAWGSSVPCLSIKDFLKFRAIMEVSACATQAYFNALAVAHTGNHEFVTSFESNDLFVQSHSFVTLQTDLIKQGKTPELIKEIVAQEFLDLPIVTTARQCEGLGVDKLTQKDISDLSVMNMARLAPHAFSKQSNVSIEDLRLILNAALPIAASENILKPYRAPLKLAPFLDNDAKVLGLAL
jgi:hypothetical protein